MIAADSTLLSHPAAQNPPRTAANPRDPSADPAREAASGANAGTDAAQASFARLVTMLRTPSLPVGDTSAGARTTAATKQARAKRSQPTTVDPVLAAATINPTKLAEQELRTASPKPNDNADGKSGGESATKAAVARAAPGRDDAAPEPVESKQPAAKFGGNAPQHSHTQHNNLQPQASTSATPISVPQRAAAQLASSGAGQPAINAVTNASATRSSQPQQASAVNAAAADRNTSRAFIAKLTRAAAPARAQLQQQHVADAAARGLGLAIKKGGGEVTMRLRPEGLGHLRIDLKIQDAKIEATLKPQTDSARDLLTDSLPHLKSALEAQGLTVERITIEPVGAPAAAQDAQHAGTDAHAATPDGSGHPRQDQQARSAAQTPVGDQAGTGTDAHEPQSPWAFAQGVTSTAPGVWEWVA
ncbi:MAG TPA: flagellar hook-length control protein FliK [Phycisphaerales bacterium]|nr:flagellar hook-length control protein FliK [Phycisphaerales bacterium]